MSLSALIMPTERGLYCPVGDFYIDAWQPVDRVVISHAHSDHARRGSKRYLVADAGAGILRKRLGSDIVVDSIPYGQSISINGVNVSLHPAGHVLGSAQVRLEHRGEVWVFTGDYKTAPDPTCTPFELVRCHSFITECTFGLPLYRWREPAAVASEINAWWRQNIEHGRTSILLAYALGKAQRVLSMLDPGHGPILLHGAVYALTEIYRDQGVGLPSAIHATADAAKAHRGRAIVIAPPGAEGSPWIRKFHPESVAVASGWMQVRGQRRRQAVDRGFVLSDHVDWPNLLATISATGATHVIGTHGYTGPLVRFLRERGLSAEEYPTRFTGETDEQADQIESTGQPGAT